MITGGYAHNEMKGSANEKFGFIFGTSLSLWRAKLMTPGPSKLKKLRLSFDEHA
jgi:hypothetical protein